MAAALAANDLALLGRALDDRIAEPVRAALVPGFTEAKQAAMRAGALGGSLSGSGPTSFALTDGDDVAARVADAMRDAHRRLGIECRVRIERVDGQGARVSDA
jgi:homoserine kinase